MVSINYAFKEIISKIVYYGPGLSGKTSNLQYVFIKVPRDTRGELISLATDADRTLYFDFLPVNVGTIQGFTTKFQLYTVPGQVYYNATRKLVLRGVDGIVFVADSQAEKIEENLESLNNLKENLEEYGYDIDQIPMVIQYNKRDLPNASSIETLERELNPRGVPYYEAIGTTGEGVFKTLKDICKLVLDQVKSKKLEPSRIVKPEPVAVAAHSPEPSRPAPRQPAPEPVMEDRHEITKGIEFSTAGQQSQAPPAQKETPPEMMSEPGTHTNIVVSDTSTEKEEDDFSATQSAPLHSEVIERSILSDDSGELVAAKEKIEELKNTSSRSKYVIEDVPWGASNKPLTSHSFDDEATQISDLSLKNSLPLAKPQMAESRKVKAKRGKFSLFGWLKKSND